MIYNLISDTRGEVLTVCKIGSGSEVVNISNFSDKVGLADRLSVIITA